MHGGVWDGRRIISKEWVAESQAPYIDAPAGFKYGFKWWLYPRKAGQESGWPSASAASD